jgi:hypothetical protein
MKSALRCRHRPVTRFPMGRVLTRDRMLLLVLNRPCLPCTFLEVHLAMCVDAGPETNSTTLL